ncbi:MAG: NADH:flavin oxidoreductase [Christensenellaceae bacterium]|nr:NADH:flavin oxidoreductase [Christensenellaceae bacterium]
MAHWNQSFKVKDVEFKNRIVMAPMLPFGWCEPGGKMHARVKEHYLMRADQGIGLLITQAFLVSPNYDVISRAGAFDESHVADIADIVSACHKSGTKVIAQLAYAGFDAGGGGGKDIHDLSDEQMAEMGDCFIRSAQLCKQAGCDGIELHCAHGSFLNVVASSANKRTGCYGGDRLGRLTLLREIVSGIRAFADEHFIIAARMGWGDDIEDDIARAAAMADLGIELLHISGGIPAPRPLDIPEGFPYNEFVYTGAKVKEATGLPVILVNDIRTLARGEALLAGGFGDMVAYGKPFLADKAFAARSAEEPDYFPCLTCKDCLWRKDGLLCPARKKTDS